MGLCREEFGKVGLCGGTVLSWAYVGDSVNVGLCGGIVLMWAYVSAVLRCAYVVGQCYVGLMGGEINNVDLCGGTVLSCVCVGGQC